MFVELFTGESTILFPLVVLHGLFSAAFNGKRVDPFVTCCRLGTGGSISLRLPGSLDLRFNVGRGGIEERDSRIHLL